MGSNKKGITIVLLFVFALVIVGSIFYIGFSRNNSENLETPPLVMVGEDLPVGRPAAKLPPRVPADYSIPVSQKAKDTIGEEKAEEAGRWAIAFAQQAAYDTTLWSLVADEKVPVKKLSKEDFSWWENFMNDEGKSKWNSLLDAGEYPAEKVDLVVLPDAEVENVEWRFPVLRPSTLQKKDGSYHESDAWNLAEVTVDENRKTSTGHPYIIVEMGDSHVYDFIKNGKWVSQRYQRPIKFFLEATTDKQNPFLLADWEIGEDTLTDINEHVKRLKPTR